MADKSTEISGRIKFDSSDVDAANEKLKHQLQLLKDIENWKNDADKRRKNSWKGIGRAALGGTMMAGAGVGGMATAGLGGSLPGLWAGAGAATTGAMKVLGASIKSMGKLAGQVSELGSGVFASLLKSFPKIGKFLGGVVDKTGKMAGIGMAALGVIAQQRMNVANMIADYQKAGMYSALSGHPTGETNEYLAAGYRLGLTPSETAAQVSQASIAAGYMGSTRKLKVMQGLSYGASAGTMGQLAGAAAINRSGGISGQAFTSKVLGNAVAEGLRGSRLNQTMSQVAQVIEQLGQQGIRTNLTGFADMMTGMRRAAKGAPAGTSQRVVNQLAQMPGTAKQQLLAPFQQAAQSLVLARAARGAGSFDEILANLESMGPEGALGALREGGDVGKYTLAQYGPSALAGKMLQARPRKGGGVGMAPGVFAGKAATARAKAAGAMISTMGSDQAGALIDAMGKLQGTMHGMAENLDDILKELPELINKALTSI